MSIEVDASKWPMHSVQVVDEDTCAVRTPHGLSAFARWCPHAGADLGSVGYVEDGKLRCGWHNLPYDLTTGRQPCRSLSDLPMRVVVPLGGDRYRLESP